jgi:outer membrane protein
MRKLLIVITILVFTFPVISISASEFEKSEPVIIGSVLDGFWTENDEILGLFQKEITDLLGREYNIQFPANKQLRANWTLEEVKLSINQLLIDPEVDIIIAAGPIGSNIICGMSEIPKPVVAPYVINLKLQNVPFNGHSSGRKNLNYIASDIDFTGNLEIYREIVDFDNITFLWPQPVITAIPELGHKIDNLDSTLPIRCDAIFADSTAKIVLDALPDDVQAVHVGLLLAMSDTEFHLLIDSLNERNLPTFAYMGKSDVEKGILAGLSPGIDFPKIARRTALNIQRILMGEDAGALPVTLTRTQRLILNVGTARKIGISPNWKVLTEAELINEFRQEVLRKINLLDAVREVADVNLDLAAQKWEVLAGNQDVNQARSNLFPQINLSALGVIIDEDRAAASFGSQAEHTITGSASFSQIIFSEPVLANLSIEKKLQFIRKLEFEKLRLDLYLEAATTYLNLLNARTVERIQKDNLRLTRSNLELARIRRVIGVSGPGEVYRWENQLAINRKQVVEALANRNVAEIALNRLLHRPAEENFLTEEIDIEDFFHPEFYERLAPYTNNKAAFKIFRQFMSEEALKNSPELKILAEALDAQKRAASSASRAFWAPNLIFAGEVTNIFSEGGAGTESSMSSLFPPESEVSIPEANDLNWNISLQMNFKLFSGGAKFAARKKTVADIRRLELERESIQEQVEQQIRSAMHVAGASSAGIEFARDAAVAAQKNLELVTDAYSRGVIPIIDLLDAQNAALVADLVESNAIHQFLIDAARVQRAAGHFYSLDEQKDFIAWLTRLDTYFQDEEF